MGIAFKHILKNVFGKPGRTLLVVICLTISSFVALMAFDMSGAMKNLFTNLYASFFGDVDFLVDCNSEHDLLFLEDPDFPENTAVYLNGYHDTYYTRIEDEYSIIEANEISIVGFDMDAAREINFFDAEVELSDTEVIISDTMAEKFEFEVGDTIILHSPDKEEIEYTIAAIQKMEGGFLKGDQVVCTLDALQRLLPSSKTTVVTVNILNDKDRHIAKEILDEKYPNVSYEYLFDNPEMEEMVNSISSLFFLLLAVCLMMVIFVTISVSDRIVCERMSVIGTLRSLGFTSFATTVILLLENVSYGLIGGTLGCLLYNLVRDPFLGTLVTTASDDYVVDFGTINPLCVVLVIVCAVLIEILCSIKETVKAVNIPIRDIIFNNKDTSYKHSKSNTIIGLVLLLVAIVCVFFKNVFVCQIVTIVAGEIAVAMLSPYAITYIANLLRKHYEKKGKTVTTLACAEVATKKNTVGAGVLISTVSALAIILLAFCQSFQNSLSDIEVFDADIYMATTSCDEVNFNYIENLPSVTEVEYEKLFPDEITINGEAIWETTSVYSSCPSPDGWIGSNMFKGVESNIDTNEIVVTTDFLEDTGLEIGDTVEITFLADYYFPVTYEMVIKDVWETDMYQTSIEINYELYHNLYGDDVTGIYVMTSDPDGVKETIEKYSGSYLYSNMSYTHEEYYNEMANQASGIIGGITFVLILGVIITFVGAAGNLLLGFESRKRECAVLLSTAFTRKQLKRVFTLESFIVSGISLLIAFPVGSLLIIPLTNAFKSMDAGIVMTYNPVATVLMFILMWIVFTFTATKPNKALQKMKLAEQLKYE